MTTTTVRTDSDDLAERVVRLGAIAGLDVVRRGAGGRPGQLLDLVDDGTGLLVADAESRRKFELPRDDEDLLALLVSAVPARAHVVGVVGAHGGAGASVLASALARESVERGLATALVDLDPAGQVIDVLLGIEHDPGSRWADLREQRGALLPERLREALPRWERVGVLAADQRGGAAFDETLARDAVRALSQVHDTVVLDLPRGVLAPGEGARAAARGCDTLVVVAGAGLRAGVAAVGATRALAAAGALPGLPAERGQYRARHSAAAPSSGTERETRAFVVVHTKAGEDVRPRDVADAAGYAEVLTMRAERGLEADVEHGLAPTSRRRGSLRRSAAEVAAAIGLAP